MTLNITIDKVVAAIFTFRYDIISYLTIIASAISILVYFFKDNIGLGTIDGVSLALSLLVSLAIFLIANAKKVDDEFTRQRDNIAKIEDKVNHNTKEMGDKIGQIAKYFENITKNDSNLFCTTEAIDKKAKEISYDVKILKNATSARIKVITSQQEFYELLDDKVKTAQHHIRITHLDPWSPTSKKFSDNSRVSYFNNVTDFAMNHETIDFKRIINIPTKDKLEWVKNLMAKTIDTKNMHYAYIKISDIENAFPYSVISCQIIDDDKMFILNPIINVVPPGQFKPCLYIENESVVSIYKEYYDRLWNELTGRNCDYGGLIKDGPGNDIFEKNLPLIENYINEIEGGL